MYRNSLSLISFFLITSSFALAANPMDSVFKSIPGMKSQKASSCLPFQKQVTTFTVYKYKIEQLRAWTVHLGYTEFQFLMDKAALQHDFTPQSGVGWLNNNYGQGFQDYDRAGEANASVGSRSWHFFMQRSGDDLFVCSLQATILGY